MSILGSRPTIKVLQRTVREEAPFHLLIYNHFSRKVVLQTRIFFSGWRKVVLQTPIFFLVQEKWLTGKKGGFIL